MTPGRVSEWLTAQGCLTTCEVSGPLQSRENSRIFYAECAGVPGPMAVKLCLTPRTAQVDSAAARRQFDTLQRVHDAMGAQADLSVPRPYVLVAEAGLLGTEWVAGQSMTSALFSLRCSSMTARELVARAARWLRRFHDCHALAPGMLDAQEKLAYLATLDNLPGERFRSILERSAAKAQAIVLARSWVHGDYTADNLLVAAGRTLAVDIEARHENTVVHDLAPFLNYLELRAFHPGGWRRLASPEALGRTFLETYLGGAVGGIAVPILWLRLYLLLQAWISARGKGASRLRSSLVDLCYGTVASRLARGLEAG